MPRTVDHDARRAAIDDAVIAIAAESGFSAITIRAAATRLDASTSMITHYVNDRNDLLQSATRRELDRRTIAAELAIGARSGAAGLRALVEWAMLGPGESGQRFWLALILGAADQPVLRAELERFNQWWDSRVHALLVEADVMDVVHAADMIDVFVDGLVINGFYENSAHMAKRRSNLIDALWSALGL